jgi:hypothetical protein
VNQDVVDSQPDPNEIDSGRSYRSGESADAAALGWSNGIDRVALGRDRPNLYHHLGTSVGSKEIDLAFRDLDVASHDP